MSEAPRAVPTWLAVSIVVAGVAAASAIIVLAAIGANALLS